MVTSWKSNSVNDGRTPFTSSRNGHDHEKGVAHGVTLKKTRNLRPDCNFGISECSAINQGRAAVPSVEGSERHSPHRASFTDASPTNDRPFPISSDVIAPNGCCDSGISRQEGLPALQSSDQREMASLVSAAAIEGLPRGFAEANDDALQRLCDLDFVQSNQELVTVNIRSPECPDERR
jgi:hypothetical protein